MEKLIIIIGIGILGLITFLLITEIINLKKIFKIGILNNEIKIGDKRYYELNNKYLLLTVISSIVLLIGGFLGYNSIAEIKSDIDKDVKYYIALQDSLLNDFILQKNASTRNFELAINEANNLIYELVELQKEYKLSTKTILVKNILTEENEKSKIVYFKDLKAVDGSKLPKFEKPPEIIVIHKSALPMGITNVTTDFFIFDCILLSDPATNENSEGCADFDILITINK